MMRRDLNLCQTPFHCKKLFKPVDMDLYSLIVPTDEITERGEAIVELRTRDEDFRKRRWFARIVKLFMYLYAGSSVLNLVFSTPARLIGGRLYANATEAASAVTKFLFEFRRTCPLIALLLSSFVVYKVYRAIGSKDFVRNRPWISWLPFATFIWRLILIALSSAVLFMSVMRFPLTDYALSAYSQKESELVIYWRRLMLPTDSDNPFRWRNRACRRTFNDLVGGYLLQQAPISFHKLTDDLWKLYSERSAELRSLIGRLELGTQIMMLGALAACAARQIEV